MAETNVQVLLRSRPTGEPTADNFELVERPAPEPGDGQVLARTVWLSVDPYMRGRMNAGRSYADAVAVGQPMCGGTVGQVVASRCPGLAEGDFVLGHGGWQRLAVEDGASLRKLDPADGPLSYALGVLGMPGLTAYVGMLDIGRPQPGQTVVVSAATGAVGQVAGQIARIVGCRVIGTAGSDAKCEFAVNDLGYEACINYKTEPLAGRFKRYCRGGIDVYFDNVGGPVLETALRFINVGARIALVGLISQYNATELTPGPNLVPLLVKRASIRGMLAPDHADREADFRRDVSAWLADGRLKYRESVVAGLENAPAAFIGLFHGQNFGKQLIKVSEPR